MIEQFFDAYIIAVIDELEMFIIVGVRKIFCTDHQNDNSHTIRWPPDGRFLSTTKKHIVTYDYRR